MRTKSSSGRNRLARRRLLRRAPIGLLLGLGAGLAVVAACGNDEARPGPPGTPTATTTGTGSGTVEPCDDGDTQQCWEEIGQNGNVLSCIEGTQTCVNGQWGACDPESVFTRDAPTQPMAFSDAASCGNPCDPGCQSWAEDPDGATSSNPTTVTLHGADIRSTIPGGHETKFLKEPCTQQCECQADHRCDTATGTCVPNLPGTTDPGCPAMHDLVTAVPCGGVIPICNRGEVDMPSQTIIGYLQPGNCLGAQDPFCVCAGFGCINPDARCEMTTSIAAGQCAFFVEADCVDYISGLPLAKWPGGEVSFVINSQDFPGSVAECRCDNNWTPVKDVEQVCPTVDIYQEATQEIVYEGSCGPGQYVQWGYFRYLADTPASAASYESSILIEAHTAETVAALTSDCSDCVTLATVETTHPDDCPFTGGPAQCPVNLYEELELPAAQESVLELVVTLRPAADGLAGPDLLEWDITYSCVDAE